ncbi:FKBP-type peptidyl-prolyl cis-trans isomerase [Chitinophaga solisilvae]|uniref:Peptidyl-prolyl cis-trans isomerase n=1 Tax=Chitinophaga solisilvae TaxID=1233460 RepID=A0A433WDB3_9BACT|nr:FKBP-type peptidyl-prolyl cis-trans isomerase [Chitinophaga solisilvae]NSL91082.1 peptidylprolyl isomerase [Chitinophaga solisilvae]
MKKVLLLGGMIIAVLAACSKKESTQENFDHVAQYDKDSVSITSYLKAKNITASHDPRGIFWNIIDSGDQKNKPNQNANVTVEYKGTFLNGTGFDSSKSVSFDLNRVIPGWTIGMQKIGKGGRIQLFIPSYYAYMQYGQGSVPPNTPLVFDVKLINLQVK